MSRRLVIEAIASEEVLRSDAHPDDLAFVAQFGSPSRRAEVLAWRGVVRREVGSDVLFSYDEYGAPRVNIPNIYISVSHSREAVAVLFADESCAVDIEDSGRNFRRVASKYLSDAEQSMAEHDDIYAEMWSAKEALYKLYRKGALDFVADVTIKEYRRDEGCFVASILGGEDVEVRVKREGNYVIAQI